MPICSNSSQGPYTVMSNTQDSCAEPLENFRAEGSLCGVQEVWRFMVGSSRRPWIICPWSDRIIPFIRGSSNALKLADEFIWTSYTGGLFSEARFSHLPETPEICKRSVQSPCTRLIRTCSPCQNKLTSLGLCWTAVLQPHHTLP